LPQSGCTRNKKALSVWTRLLVGDERIELPQVESESTALPLCKSPSGFGLAAGALPTVIIILRFVAVVNPQNQHLGQKGKKDRCRAKLRAKMRPLPRAARHILHAAGHTIRRKETKEAPAYVRNSPAQDHPLPPCGAGYGARTLPPRAGAGDQRVP